MSGGGNEGSGSSWGARFLKGASVVAASAAVAAGLYAALSSSASANSELEAPFGARREHKEDDDGGPFLTGNAKASSQVEVWKKPEIGWVKLNVDGSRDHYGPSAGCGGVFRDASGAWLCGFALKLDPIYEAQDTELRAILEGMQLASKMKFEKLIVESDNKEVVTDVVEDKLKFKKHSQPRKYELIKSIRDLLTDPKWQVELVYISGKANQVADRLANIARTLSFDDLQEYPSPPDGNINSFHLKDIAQGRVSIY